MNIGEISKLLTESSQDVENHIDIKGQNSDLWRISLSRALDFCGFSTGPSTAVDNLIVQFRHSYLC